MPTTPKKAPKALVRQFSPAQPTAWFVRISGHSFGSSAEVKQQLDAALQAMFDAAGLLPGMQQVRITAQAPREHAKPA